MTRRASLSKRTRCVTNWKTGFDMSAEQSPKERRALCTRLGETLVGARPDGSPTEETAEEYRSARGIRQAIDALQAEDVALAADSSVVSRGARFARSLVSVGERGATYARSMKVESRLKKLEEQRSALFAKLGRALAPHRADCRASDGSR